MSSNDKTILSKTGIHSGLLKIVCIAILVISARLSVAQGLSYGITLGTYIPYKSGVNQLDSIRVVYEGDKGDGERSIGFFISKELSNRLSAKVNAQYFPTYSGYVVYNSEATCLFCPVEKVSSSRTSVVEINPQIQVRLWNIGQVKIGVNGGFSLHLQYPKNEQDIDFNGKHPGVAEVINALDETPKDVVSYVTYGVSLQYKIAELSWRQTENLNNSFTDEIFVYGQMKPFKNTARYTFIILSISMNSFFRSSKRNNS